MSLGLEPEEKILLVSRIGRFIKRMLTIKKLAKEVKDSDDFGRMSKFTKNKVTEIEHLASKKEDE